MDKILLTHNDDVSHNINIDEIVPPQLCDCRIFGNRIFFFGDCSQINKVCYLLYLLARPFGSKASTYSTANERNPSTDGLRSAGRYFAYINFPHYYCN